MKFLPLIGLLLLGACTDDGRTPRDYAAYYDQLDNVPGTRTDEADYYYSHRGAGGFAVEPDSPGGIAGGRANSVGAAHGHALNR